MASSEENIIRKTSEATRWSLFAEVAAKLISPVTNMVLARILTPEAFGVVATVTMVVSFADVFADAGFQKYLIQHDFNDRDDLHKGANVAFWTNLSISVIAWALIAIFSNQIAQLVGNAGLGHVIIIASLSLPLTSFVSVQMALFKRDFDFKTLFRIRIAVVLVPLVVTIPLALCTESYWALVIGTLASNLVNALLLTLASSWRPSLFYSVTRLRKMFSYSWWILSESIAVWLTSYIDTFIVGICLNSYQLGLYKTSMVTVNAIFSLIVSATSGPLFSALSRLKDNSEALKRTYLNYIRAIGVFVVPLGFGLWVYGDVVTRVLLGSQWGEASAFIGMWGLAGSVCLVLGTYCNGLYNAIGKTMLSFLSQVLHLVVLVPVVWLTACGGFDALCIGRSLVRLELVAVQFVLMWKFAGIKPSDSLRNLGLVFLCSGLMTVFAIALRKLFSVWWEPIIGIPLCVIVYLAAMRLLAKGVITSSLSQLGFSFERIIGKNDVNTEHTASHPESQAAKLLDEDHIEKNS